jgi:outer membrane protein OmpA-like peptidoglycan-associated protein
MKPIAQCGFAILLGTLAFSLSAQEAGNRKPNAEQIVERLATPAPTSQGRTRGWRGVTVEAADSQPGAAPSIDLEVNFEYASAQLSSDARIVLDNLGQALNHASLQSARIKLVGHTDAKGGDAYNLTLSRQRAQTVANYLSNQHGIAAQRLTVEGMGRSQLAVVDEPYSALNRRVQVINLGQP